MIYDSMVHYGLKVFFLSLIALSLMALLRKASAATRSFFAVVSLFVLLTVPYVSYQLPGRTVEAPKSIVRSISYVESPQTALINSAKFTYFQPETQSNAISMLDVLCEACGRIWLIGVAVLLGRLAMGFLRIGMWMRSASVHMAGVFVSDAVDVPVSVWFGKSAILIPAQALEWDAARVNRVLAHERAHLERRDLLWNLIGQIACAIYWPLPTIWILQKLARNASERACDDQVLRTGAVASDYAQDLVGVAAHFDTYPSPALPIVTRSEIRKRVEHILDPLARRGSSGALSKVLSGAFCLTALPVAVYGLAHFSDVHPQVKRRNSPQSVGVPGTPQNNFIGTFPDGRKIQLLQFERYDGHNFTAWRPDGKELANPRIYVKDYFAQWTWPGGARIPIDAGDAVGVFKYVNAPNNYDQRRYDYWFISHRVPHTDDEVTMGDLIVGATYPVKLHNNSSLDYDRRNFTSAKLWLNPKVSLPKLDNKQHEMMDKAGHFVMETRPSSEFDFVLHRPVFAQLQVIAIDKLGQRHDALSFGIDIKQIAYRTHQGRVYFNLRPDQITRIDVREMHGVYVKFSGFKTAPNK